MTPESAESLRTAELLHDQAQYLLNDEISYAASLKDSRKTASGLLILVVGIGIFRFEMYRPAAHVSTVPAGWSDVIRWLFFVALCLLGYGGYRIYTERPLWKEFWRNPKSSGSALSVLNLRQEVLESFQAKTPLETMRMKTDGLRLAYTRLRDANRRVRARITSGTSFVFSGLLLVLLAFGVYTFTVDFSGGGAPVDVKHHEVEAGGQAAPAVR